MQEILAILEHSHRSKVKTALNGQEALSLIMKKTNLQGGTKRCNFDLIFLDLHMPVLDGF
jgi:CheY-like chemotaxis protein